jgi:MFS family permease
VGDQRISSCSGADAAAERLACGAHRGQKALPHLLFRIHALLSAVRAELVREFPDRVSHTSGSERRTDGIDDATDDGARCRQEFVRVMGYAAVPILLGPILGPAIAGAILQYASWRWLFLINLPIGILAVTLAFCFLPDDHDQRADRRELDLIGFFLLSPGLVLFLYGSDHLGEHAGMAALLLSVILLAAFFRKALRDRERALIDLQLFRSRAFSASALTQFTVNGLSFAGQMLIPLYLIRAADQSPSTTGWLMAPLGLGMICNYPSLARFTKRFGIRRTSAGGASLALLGTLPFLYLSGHHLNLTILAGALFMRGVGMSAVGIPSISAAYASVRKEDLPMATTSLNIVQRLGGPTLTTFCATLLGWRLADAYSHSGVASAFTISVVLLFCLHVLLISAALRLPRSIDEAAERSPREEQPAILEMTE